MNDTGWFLLLYKRQKARTQFYSDMSKLRIYTKSEISELTDSRKEEIKFGERIQFINSSDNWPQQLKHHSSQFVILGIPEDIGVRANMGRGGTATAWDNFLKNFLNIQHNRLCRGEWVSLMGELDFSEEMERSRELNPEVSNDREKMFDLVAQIDEDVEQYVTGIIRSGKIPIIIGGGHNNAYGNIKALSKVKEKSVNVINFDAHTDLRPTKGRHSGNGFSYALEEGLLKNYFIFGLHENYISENIFNEVQKISHRVKYNTYEEIGVRNEKSFEDELLIAQRHIETEPFGLEIDLDSIPMFASSAITSSGFSAEHTRRFIHYFAQLKNVCYLHLCEGAPELYSNKNRNLVGKLISYLVTDFMKSYMNSRKTIK